MTEQERKFKEELEEIKREVDILKRKLRDQEHDKSKEDHSWIERIIKK